jgi:hypothetical protein
MTYAIKKYGFLPDFLDCRDAGIRSPSVQARLKQVLPRTAAGLASPPQVDAGGLVVDLRPWCSPIEDQGEVGSCTANAVVGALEYFETRTRGAYVDASRLFLYRVTRRFLGWAGQGDTGAFVRSAIKSLRLFGAPPERYWPYDVANWDAEPDAFVYAYAQSFKALEYFRLDPSVDQLKSSLRSGLPFVFGFTCYESLETAAVRQTGIVPYPSPNERTIGGHAVLAVGYSDTHVLFKNSWGANWGDAGYGRLPWTYFDRDQPLATDFWALINADWVADDEADFDVMQFAPQARSVSNSGVIKVEPGARTERAYVSITQGIDPLRALPLRLSSTGIVPRDAAAPTALAQTKQPVSLSLKSLTLKSSFDWSLFGKAVNEVYLLAVLWDLSGQPPQVWPVANAAAVPGEYQIQEGDVWQFLGDGLLLWPSGTVVGNLYVRLVLMESDADIRNIGRQVSKFNDAISASALPAALSALVAGISSAGVLTAVAQATSALTGVIAKALSENGDDQVALFEGSYAASSLDASRNESYDQRGAAIELQLTVG